MLYSQVSMVKPMLSKVVFTRVSSGPYTTLASKMTHSKPIQTLNLFSWVLGYTLTNLLVGLYTANNED